MAVLGRVIDFLATALAPYTFLIMYVMLFVLILGFFTMFFFEYVISQTGVEQIKQYFVNVAKVDPSVAEILMSAKRSCTAVDADGKPVIQNAASADVGNKLFDKSPVMISLYVLCGVSGIVFFIHSYTRMRKRRPLFSSNEIVALLFLIVPIIFEILTYYMVYAKYKFYSNVYLIKLMKNMRILEDLQYLDTLYKNDRDSLDGAQSSNTDGSCSKNCLTPQERADVMKSIDDQIGVFGTFISGEKSKIEPKLSQKIMSMPGIAVSTFLCLAILAMLAATYGLSRENGAVVVPIFWAIGLYVMFISLFWKYVRDGKFQTIATYDSANRLFCQTDTDFVTRALGRNLVVGQYADDEIDQLAT